MSIFLTPMALIAGFYLLILGAGMLLVNVGRPLRLLSNEIAERVEQSIAVLDECNPHSRAKRPS
mgnify:CR=1 FL=1